MLVCTPNISRKVHKLPLGKETGGPEEGVGGSLAFHCVPLIHLLIGIFTLLVNSFARILTRPFRGGSPCRQSSQVQEPEPHHPGLALSVWEGDRHMAPCPPEVKHQQAFFAVLAVIIKWKLCIETILTTS